MKQKFNNINIYVLKIEKCDPKILQTTEAFYNKSKTQVQLHPHPRLSQRCDCIAEKTLK